MKRAHLRGRFTRFADSQLRTNVREEKKNTEEDGLLQGITSTSIPMNKLHFCEVIQSTGNV